ncbi:MAG: hypothetical protein AVDCRST_MAG20-147, partial [uncultured Acidimicrobiales bacterium]
AGSQRRPVGPRCRRALGHRLAVPAHVVRSWPAARPPGLRSPRPALRDHPRAEGIMPPALVRVPGVRKSRRV